MSKLKWDRTAQNIYKVLLQLVGPFHEARMANRRSKPPVKNAPDPHPMHVASNQSGIATIPVTHRFQLAAKYATKVMKDPDLLHSYGELHPNATSFYKLAFNDALLGPKLGEPVLQLAAGNSVSIIVPATDNVGVAQVEFSIMDPQNQALAEGNASKAKSRDEWTCKTRCTMEQLAGAQLFIKASDLAGNQAIIRKTL